ncbi:MAG: hypothetical protein WC903_05775 [Candidatus Margulisiibacteriota bacterium]
MNPSKCLFLIMILLFSTVSFADQNKYVIIKVNQSVPQGIGGQPKFDLQAGQIYSLEGILTGESPSEVYYKISYSSTNDIFVVNSKSVNLLKEDFSINRMNEIRASWAKDNKALSFKSIRDKFKTLKSELDNWDYSVPYEYEIIKIVGLLDVNYSASKTSFKQANSFYKEAREYILALLNKTEINPHAYSVIASSLLGLSPALVFDSRANYELAKEAFDKYPSDRSSESLLLNLGGASDDVDPGLIESIFKYAKANSANNTMVGNYYYYSNNKSTAEVYYRVAESLAKIEPPKEKNYYIVVGRPNLAKILEDKEDYAGAAEIYLELENYFKAAWCYGQSLDNDVAVPGMDYYKIIDLYERSNDPSGYYNAGLIYVNKYSSPRNARLMAKILKEKYNNSEYANILLDAADKLDARLKGHNP